MREKMVKYVTWGYFLNFFKNKKNWMALFNFFFRAKNFTTWQQKKGGGCYKSYKDFLGIVLLDSPYFEFMYDSNSFYGILYHVFTFFSLSKFWNIQFRVVGFIFLLKKIQFDKIFHLPIIDLVLSLWCII